MADQQRLVTGGVDTHKATHVAAVVDELGRILGTESFPAAPAGYRSLLRWLRSFGVVARVGVEGTGAYGAGLARQHQTLTVDLDELRDHLDTLTATANPAL